MKKSKNSPFPPLFAFETILSPTYQRTDELFTVLTDTYPPRARRRCSSQLSIVHQLLLQDDLEQRISSFLSKLSCQFLFIKSKTTKRGVVTGGTDFAGGAGGINPDRDRSYHRRAKTRSSGN
jgi:hypothetical protein